MVSLGGSNNGEVTCRDQYSFPGGNACYSDCPDFEGDDNLKPKNATGSVSNTFMGPIQWDPTPTINPRDNSNNFIISDLYDERITEDRDSDKF